MPIDALHDMHLHRSIALIFGFLSFVCLAHADAAIVAASAEEAKPLSVGVVAPTVELLAADGSKVNLASEFAAKPTILVFYRGSWCPFCNRQLSALGELQPQLLELGYQIIAVSPDNATGLEKMTGTNHLSYRLLSDRAMRASPAYGVAFHVAPAIEEKYRQYGVSLAPAPDGSGPWLPVPSVFVIGSEGIIKFVYSNPDYGIRLGNEDLLAAAKANVAK